MNGCKDCVNRKVGCHGTCEKYREWRKNYDKQKKLIKSQERKYYDYFYE